MAYALWPRSVLLFFAIAKIGRVGGKKNRSRYHLPISGAPTHASWRVLLYIWECKYPVLSFLSLEKCVGCLPPLHSTPPHNYSACKPSLPWQKPNLTWLRAKAHRRPVSNACRRRLLFPRGTGIELLGYSASGRSSLLGRNARIAS